MSGRTFVEKIFEARAGEIVFYRPDLVLSHDNSFSIEKIFRKMHGIRVADPEQLVIVLDHNAPPTDSGLANQYQSVRMFCRDQGIRRFHDAGEGICHQVITRYIKPGMVIVGSDSHTCTGGALNAFAAGIDRTETAGLWNTGETWFRVPETIKIMLGGELRRYVSAKDVALTIIGMIGASGADYLSMEFHGSGVQNLTISDRMTICNMAAEAGAKNAVFPSDGVTGMFLGYDAHGIWADHDAKYCREIDLDLSEVVPMVACPHRVDHVKTVQEAGETELGQALVGTCTNGRIEDLREAAAILRGNKVPPGFQLLVVPASREIFLQAVREKIIETFIEAGACILSPSCGPCLGTGQGIPADDVNVISTANRNFPGRMGNKNARIYLASPETVAFSAIHGKLATPFREKTTKTPVFIQEEEQVTGIPAGEIRKADGVWDYTDADNLNTDQMFAGSLTYRISSADAGEIIPHLFAGFDPSFAKFVEKGDLLMCGKNFGCGSSREHPAVGLRGAGVKALIVKSVSRIFYRSAINQGLPVIVLPEAVEYYQRGFSVVADLARSLVMVNEKEFRFSPLPEKLLSILESGGLVNSIVRSAELEKSREIK